MKLRPAFPTMERSEVPHEAHLDLVKPGHVPYFRR